MPEKKADKIIARSMIRMIFIFQSYCFFLCLSLTHAKTKQIRAIKAKTGTLLIPLVNANLIPAATHRIPVITQMISSIRMELFLIF